MKEEIFLGIDPGSLITGYGVVSLKQKKMQAIDFGCIRPKTKKLSLRYRYIFEGLLELFDRYQPVAIAVESQFVQKNVKSALKLGMAKGACVIAASLRNIPIFEYAPTRAKCSVVGYGRASKAQVQAMVKNLLSLPKIPEPEDAADALALAICHIHSLNLNTHMSSEI